MGLNKIRREKDVILPTNCLVVNTLVVVLYDTTVNHGQSERHRERGLIASSDGAGAWRGLLRIPWTACGAHKSLSYEIKPTIPLAVLGLCLGWYGHLMVHVLYKTKFNWVTWSPPKYVLPIIFS